MVCSTCSTTSSFPEPPSPCPINPTVYVNCGPPPRPHSSIDMRQPPQPPAHQSAAVAGGAASSSRGLDAATVRACISALCRLRRRRRQSDRVFDPVCQLRHMQRPWRPGSHYGAASCDGMQGLLLLREIGPQEPRLLVPIPPGLKDRQGQAQPISLLPTGEVFQGRRNEKGSRSKRKRSGASDGV